MIVTATEFKTNLGKYLELAAVQDVLITKKRQKYCPANQSDYQQTICA